MLILDGKEDDIERALMDMMGVDRIATEQQTRKFRNLKILVLWLQKDQRFGRFCYYGCYCLPEGSHDIAAGGYGKPLDAIDRACFDFKQCYRCLLDEHDAAGQTIRNGSKSLFVAFANRLRTMKFSDKNLFLLLRERNRRWEVFGSFEGILTRFFGELKVSQFL